MVLRVLPLCNMQLLIVWLLRVKGAHGVSWSTICFDGDLELREAGSKVELITDLHWGVIVPMTTSLQDCQGRVGAYCLVRGLNHWPNLSAFLLLPPRWSPDVAPSIHGWPCVLSLSRQFPLLWLPLNPCLEQ